jgi:carnitine O-palmitoyltransferase 1
VVAGVMQAPRGSWFRSGKVADFLWRIDSKNPLSHHFPVWYRVGYLAAGCSLTIMLGYSAIQRLFLQRLLSYHGWLDRKQHNTIKNKLWGLIMTKVFLHRISKQLYAYQWCLPYLPLPDVAVTCEKYMETVKPLLSPEEYATHHAQMREFLANEARPLQNRLRLKWFVSQNYISDWWLDFVYLRSRESLPINSNWYGISFADYAPTQSQTVRAAVAAYLLVRTKLQLDKETFEPLIVSGVAPLCMAQYEYAFSTTRIPCPEQDRLQKYDPHESRHIIVIHKGSLYKLPVFSSATMNQLTPLQLLKAFEGIVESNEEVSSDEALIPALTAMNRTEWAQIREEFFERDPHNCTRLEAIESAMFVISLEEDTPADFDWTAEGKLYMCGNNHSRWCDKSFNVIITKNAKAGVHAEHAWGDAPALAHILEVMMLSEKAREFYNDDGTVKLLPQDEAKLKSGKLVTYPAQRIDFRVSRRLAEHCRRASREFQASIDDFELYVDIFDVFGKKFIAKTAKVSPDAFIQMALQLAYFRDQGHFDLTYESSMTRLFRQGRTETIRSLSAQSCAFVKAFEGKTASKGELQTLLKQACERHQNYTMECMQGKGVDRHLFALYVVSVGINKPSAFLKTALGRKWKLSTSQVPPKQCSDAQYKAARANEIFCPNGGFGPVSDEGYGVCYNVWDGRCYFNVSTKLKSPNTNARRFHGRIRQALRDIAALFEETK